ncbi:MAG: glutathione S-transferase family protein [Pseudomonadota bacterium]
MRTLFYSPFDPQSRTIRLILTDAGLAHRLVDINLTRMDDDVADSLAAANPAMTLPVLLDETPSGQETAISPAWAAIEYLAETHPDSCLLPQTAGGKAEVRRILSWFFDKFETEVSSRLGPGRSVAGEERRLGFEALKWHADYIEWLLERRACLAGERLTAADFAAAAYLSILDYSGDALWRHFPETAKWYARLKSRDSMQTILEDTFPGIRPSPDYRNTDF